MIHTALLAASLGSSLTQTAQDNGVVRVKSAYNVDEIAQRHGITNRGEQFKTASGVVASITSAVTK
jgi:hypothetical protein